MVRNPFFLVRTFCFIVSFIGNANKPYLYLIHIMIVFSFFFDMFFIFAPKIYVFAPYFYLFNLLYYNFNINEVDIMINRIATRITEKFIDYKIIDKSSKSIYKYGLELIISSVLSVLLITTIGLVFFTIADVFIFLVIFIAMRSLCGGYHATSYVYCNIVSISSFLFSASLSSYFKLSEITLIAIIPTCFFILAWISPVDNEYKKIEGDSYLKLKIASLIAYVIVASFSVVCYKLDHYCCSIILYTLLTVTILSTIGFFKQLKRKEY